MPFVIDEIILSSAVAAVISRAVNSALDVLQGGNPSGDSNANLEKFLEILSGDFAFTVENVIKIHFTHMRMDDLHAHIVSAADHMKLYISSGDMQHLLSARRIVIEKIHNFWLRALFPKLAVWDVKNDNAEAVLGAGLDLLEVIVAFEMFVFTPLVYFDVSNLGIIEQHCENYHKAGSVLIRQFERACNAQRDKEHEQFKKILGRIPKSGPPGRLNEIRQTREAAEKKFLKRSADATHGAFLKIDKMRKGCWIPLHFKLEGFKSKIPEVAEAGALRIPSALSILEPEILHDAPVTSMAIAATMALMFCSAERVREAVWYSSQWPYRQPQPKGSSSHAATSGLWRKRQPHQFVKPAASPASRFIPEARAGLRLLRAIFR